MKSKIPIITIVFAIVIFACACQFEMGHPTDMGPEITYDSQISTDDEAERDEHNIEESDEYFWRENSSKIIDEVKAELEDKGWSIVDVIEGWSHWREWNIYETRLTEEEENMFVYTVWGQWEGLYDTSIDVIVRIAFSDEAPEGEIYKVFYRCSEAGKTLEADQYEGDPLEDITEILPTNDEWLLEYMYAD